MTPLTPSILYIGKRGNHYCEEAQYYLIRHFPNTTSYVVARGDSWPRDCEHWQGDYIISYLSPFVIPEAVLSSARCAAINFHPGPPEYPGIGCTNFAIYNAEELYGVTCHHMAAKVDTGSIIFVDRFKVFPNDDVYAVTQRCYAHLQKLFYRVVDHILLGESLPVSDERWQRKPYTRAELKLLGRITEDMSEEEVKRRVKAMTYPSAPGAYVEWFNAKLDVKLNN